jgi:cytochrome c-type biogenesis protein CcsB
MSFTEWSYWVQLNASTRWMLGADAIAVVGIVLALWAAVQHIRAAAGGDRRPLRTFQPQVLAVIACAAALTVSLVYRAAEVNHFPSQTMSEVLTVFNACLLGSMLVLHFVLRLHDKGPGWAVLNDALHLLVFGGVLAISYHIGTQSTAQRDLPPALQSYWFAPHILALITSYALLGIAALICLFYFVTRFWSGVVHGGQTFSSQSLILLALVLVPFAHFVTAPALLILPPVVFGLAWVYHRLLARRTVAPSILPDATRIRKLEKELDDVSFRAFAVGIPFLTAGLWMGSFWAQEAWANYWGWDSKENSALISWLIYVIYMHLRLLGGYRGAKAMSVLMAGALSIFITFQIFGYLPDSQKSLHRYTDDAVSPQEGQMGPRPEETAQR